MYKYLYSFVLAGSINSYLKVLVPLGTAVCTNKYLILNFRIVIGPRRLAGDVAVEPSFSDSVAPIGAAFKQTSTRGSAPRMPPKPQRGAGIYAWRYWPGGDRPPPDKG